jgi:hypothetical protein
MEDECALQAVSHSDGAWRSGIAASLPACGMSGGSDAAHRDERQAKVTDLAEPASRHADRQRGRRRRGGGGAGRPPAPGAAAGEDPGPPPACGMPAGQGLDFADHRRLRRRPAGGVGQPGPAPRPGQAPSSLPWPRTPPPSGRRPWATPTAPYHTCARHATWRIASSRPGSRYFPGAAGHTGRRARPARPSPGAAG